MHIKKRGEIKINKKTIQEQKKKKKKKKNERKKRNVGKCKARFFSPFFPPLSYHLNLDLKMHIFVA